MLEQGHVIDPDSQQAGQISCVLLTRVASKVNVERSVQPQEVDLEFRVQSHAWKVVGMIRPMTGDFEFFDPIPLPAGNLGQRGTGV